MIDRTQSIIISMLRDNDIKNVDVEFNGFNYNPVDDSISLDNLIFTIKDKLSYETVTGILNTIKELQVIKIEAIKKSIIFQ